MTIGALTKDAAALPSPPLGRAGEELECDDTLATVLCGPGYVRVQRFSFASILDALGKVVSTIFEPHPAHPAIGACEGRRRLTARLGNVGNLSLDEHDAQELEADGSTPLQRTIHAQ